MSNKNLTIGLIVVGIIAIIALVTPAAKSNTPGFGGVTNYDALTLDNGDLTLTNGNITLTNGNITNSTAGKTLTLTTSNTATSTLKVGCIQMNATSTATNIRLLFSASATTTISGTAAGTVAWGYGTCPF